MDNKNIVLVRLYHSNLQRVTPPLGIGYLLKALSKIERVNPIFIDCHLEKIETDSLLRKLKEIDPAMIGFQVFSLDYPLLVKILPVIKKELPDAIIVAGGPHVSGLPEFCLNKNPDLDYIIRGDGEEALAQLTLNLLSGTLSANRPKIPNLVFRDGGKVIQNQISWVDVNYWGPPAWDLLHPDKYPPVQHGTFHKGKKVVPIITSRGCPYPCVFCAGHLVTGKKVRLREIKNLVDEIEYLQGRYKFDEFIIEDENFSFSKEHVKAFVNEIKARNIKCYFSFPNGLRFDHLDEEIVKMLRGIGTYSIAVGIESGSKATLNRMRKNWDLDDLLHKLKLLRKNNIVVYSGFILGFRDETMEDIRDSIRFALKCGVDFAIFRSYLPLPGTEDFNFLLRRGDMVLDEIRWELYNTYTESLPYHPKEISESQLKKAIRSATLKFYFRPVHLIKLALKTYSMFRIKTLVIRIFRQLLIKF